MQKCLAEILQGMGRPSEGKREGVGGGYVSHGRPGERRGRVAMKPVGAPDAFNISTQKTDSRSIETG